MPVSDEVRASHRDLSPVSERYLEHVLADPARHVPSTISSWVQAWPTLVGADKLAAMRGAAIAVSNLVRAIPERVFGGDAAALGAYFGVSPAALEGGMFQAPTGLAGALARPDFIDSAEGFKCLEINMSARLGGWQARFWEGAMRADLAGFLAHSPLATSPTDRCRPWPRALRRRSTI